MCFVIGIGLQTEIFITSSRRRQTATGWRLRAEHSPFDSRLHAAGLVLGGAEEVGYPLLLRHELAPDLLVLRRRRAVDVYLCWPIYM